MTAAGSERRSPRGFTELLAEQATPEVLRDNPFRILGLSTTSTNRDLRRQAERMRRDPDVAPHEAERVEAALRRLRDPVQRLVDELLWFWPDEADGETGHNAAVRALLDLVEGDAGDTVDRGIVERGGAAIDAMARSLRTPATVTHVAARAAALDDPRVAATGDAQALVDDAHRLVPLVALRMAARAHDGGEATRAAALAATVRTHAGAEVARAAATTVVEPAIGRVRALVDAAERESRDDREEGAERAARLMEQTAADRALVDLLLGDTDPARVGMVDRLVDQFVTDVVAAYNETAAEATALGLLQQARDLRPGPALQARIDRNLKTIGDNADLRRCWFCQEAPSEPRANVQLTLHGEIHRDYMTGRTRWSTTNLAVPRCSSCAARQHRHDTVGCSIGAAAAVLGAAIVGATVAASAANPVVAGAIWLALFVPLGVVSLVAMGRDTRRRMRQFPPLQEKLAAGWAFGERPPKAH